MHRQSTHTCSACSRLSEELRQSREHVATLQATLSATESERDTFRRQRDGLRVAIEGMGTANEWIERRMRPEGKK